MSDPVSSGSLQARIASAFAGVPEPSGARFRGGMTPFEATRALAFGPGGSDADRVAALLRYPELVFSMRPETLAWYMPHMLQACLVDPGQFFDLYVKLDFLFQKDRISDPADEPYIREIDAAFSPAQKDVIRDFFAANRSSNLHVNPNNLAALRF